MNILIVEDEALTALFLAETVASLSHHVVATVDNAEDAMAAASKEAVDLVLMDIEIKGKQDGIQAAKAFKENNNTPVVFITSYKDSQTIQDAKFVSPLGYLIKPVTGNEVEAVLMVVENQLKNGIKKQGKLHAVGPYRYNGKTHTLTHNAEPVALTQKEMICLEYLFENVDTNVSSEQLMRMIWDGDAKELSSLRELIFRLRKKVPGLNIKSISKFGYILLSK
jgi:DNA-binding response OmpR family regulator